MLKSFFSDHKKTIFSAAVTVGFFSLASRALGLFRDRLLASTFGAGETLDTYYAAFRIPDLIFNLLVLGALSAAFIPVFCEYLTKYKKEGAFRLANSMLNLLALAILFASCAIFIFAKPLMSAIAPGFSDSQKQLTAQLTRIMLISPLFFGISNIFSGILNSFKRFLVYSIAPCLYNFGIILGVIVFAPWLGIKGVALGVVLGAFLHMAIQAPNVFRLGFRYKPILSLKEKGIRTVAKLMVPRTIGLAAQQINLWVITIIASMLTVGSVAVFNLANNLQYFPIGIFGVAFATAAFPHLSLAASRNNIKEFKIRFSQTFRQILFFIVPVSGAMLLLRAQIVRLILGTGKFDWEDTVLTYKCLGYFCLGIFALGLVPLLAKAFYSLKDTRTPVVISLLTMGVNVGLSIWLSRVLEVAGLALAFALAGILNLLLLLLILRKRMGDLEDQKTLSTTLKIIGATVVMGLAIQGSKYLIAPWVNMQTGVGVLAQTLGAALAGLLVYLGLGFLLKVDEVKVVKKFLPWRR